MQRLFTMFPRGLPGVGLILLRFLVAVTFVVESSARGTLMSSIPLSLLFVTPALMLCLGFLTPYIATFCVFVEVLLLFNGAADPFHISLAGLMSGTLVLLGPGGYSLDAIIFGRRRLT